MKTLWRRIAVSLIIVIGLFMAYQWLTHDRKQVQPNRETQVVVMTHKSLLAELFPEVDIEWIMEGGWTPAVTLESYRVYVDYDSDEGLVTIADGNEIIRYDMVYGTAQRNGERFQMAKPVILGDEIWVPVKDMGQVFGLEFDVNEDQRTIFVKDESVTYTLGTAERDTYLYASTEADRILKKVKSGDSLVVFEAEGPYELVMTSDYQVGLLEDEAITDKRVSPGEEDTAISDDPKVFLTWEIYGRGYDTSTIGPMEGVNVISPAWYALSDAKGKIKSKASETYTDWAHERGYSVWALVSNDFDIDRTHEFLHSASARRIFVEQLLKEYTAMDYQGVNLDFENIYKDDKRQLTQFVAELTSVFRQAGLTVSMDVTVMGGSDNWSKCYDHEALGHIVDYLAVMTYDEHWASSPKSGSVASYSWVKRGIEEIAQVVPSQKILLGIPYYMRVWTETPSQEKANTMEVKSGVLNMPNAEKFIEEKQLNLIWDESARQYYAGYIEDGTLKKIWFENGQSIQHKASLVNELNLGGVAVWRRGFETQDIWSIIHNEIR